MSTKMKAVILAAGKGSRLYPLTTDIPKCMIEVGGRPLIDWQLEAIEKIGIKDTLVVVGYQKEAIQKHLGNRVYYREYADYAKTNNLHTLWHIKDELKNSDFMCFFADLIYEISVLEDLKKASGNINLVVDTGQILDGTMRIRIEGGNLTAIGDQVPKDEGSGNFIGISKFSSAGAKLLFEQMGNMMSGHEKDYYTEVLNVLISQGHKIGYIDIKKQIWAEIDTISDLQRVELQVIPKLILTKNT